MLTGALDDIGSPIRETSGKFTGLGWKLSIVHA
jgi:hypothetical protein